jgi:hypothetical protein
MYLQTKSVSKVGWILAALGAGVLLLSRGTSHDLALLLWSVGAFVALFAGIIYMVSGKQFDP